MKNLMTLSLKCLNLILTKSWQFPDLILQFLVKQLNDCRKHQAIRPEKFAKIPNDALIDFWVQSS